MVSGERAEARQTFNTGRSLAKGALLGVATSALILSMDDKTRGNVLDYLPFTDSNAEAAEGATKAVCPAPDQESIDAVAAMIDLPDGYIQTANQNTTIGSSYDEQARQAAAAAHDINLPRFDTGTYQELRITLSEDRSVQPFVVYQSFLEEVLGQHGLTLELGDKQPDSGQFVSAPTAEDLESTDFKYKTLAMASYFSQLPLQLTSGLPLEHVGVTVHGDGYMGGADFDQRTLLVDFANSGDEYNLPGILSHELVHFIDLRYCGTDAYSKDPAYSGLNRHASYAPEGNAPEEFMLTQPQTLDDIQPELATLDMAAARALFNDDFIEYCRLEARIDSLLASVEMANLHSHRNVGEDRANNGAVLMRPWEYDEAFDASMPVIRDKNLFHFARFREIMPNVVDYYLSIGDRPANDSIGCQ